MDPKGIDGPNGGVLRAPEAVVTSYEGAMDTLGIKEYHPAAPELKRAQRGPRPDTGAGIGVDGDFSHTPLGGMPPPPPSTKSSSRHKSKHHSKTTTKPPKSAFGGLLKSSRASMAISQQTASEVANTASRRRSSLMPVALPDLSNAHAAEAAATIEAISKIDAHSGVTRWGVDLKPTEAEDITSTVEGLIANHRSADAGLVDFLTGALLAPSLTDAQQHSFGPSIKGRTDHISARAHQVATWISEAEELFHAVVKDKSKPPAAQTIKPEQDGTWATKNMKILFLAGTAQVKAIKASFAALEAVDASACQGVHVPIQAILSYAGHHAFVAELTPANAENAYLGSGVHQDCTLAASLAATATALGVGGTSAGRHGYPADGAWHSIQGVHWVSNIGTWFPRDVSSLVPSALNQTADPARAHNLRPELYASAVQVAAKHNAPGAVMDEAAAVSWLHETVIPEFINWIALPASSGSIEPVDLPLLMHERGINMRYMGLIRAGLDKASLARRTLLTEIVARVLKRGLRSALLNAPVLPAHSLPEHVALAHAALAAKFLNDTFSASSAQFWTTHLPQMVNAAFPCALDAQEAAKIRSNLSVPLLMRRLCDSVGLTLTDDTWTRVFTEGSSGDPLLKMPAAFVVDDIVGVMGTTSLLSRHARVLGAAHFLQALAPDTKLEALRTHLLLGEECFNAAVRAAPANSNTQAIWAELLLTMANSLPKKHLRKLPNLPELADVRAKQAVALMATSAQALRTWASSMWVKLRLQDATYDKAHSIAVVSVEHGSVKDGRKDPSKTESKLLKRATALADTEAMAYISASMAWQTGTLQLDQGAGTYDFASSQMSMNRADTKYAEAMGLFPGRIVLAWPTRSASGSSGEDIAPSKKGSSKTKGSTIILPVPYSSVTLDGSLVSTSPEWRGWHSVTPGKHTITASGLLATSPGELQSMITPNNTWSATDGAYTPRTPGRASSSMAGMAAQLEVTVRPGQTTFVVFRPDKGGLVVASKDSIPSSLQKHFKAGTPLNRPGHMNLVPAPATVPIFLPEAVSVERVAFMELGEAVAAGNTRRVAEISHKLGVNLNNPSYSGIRPIHQAVMAGSVGMVRALLKANVDPLLKTTEGRTPLSYALVSVNASIVLELVRAGAPPNENFGKYSPLGVAVLCGHEELIKYLITEAGVPVNEPVAPTPDALQPIFLAVDAGNEHIVDLLVDLGADVASIDPTGRTPLFYPTLMGKLELVKLLLESGADPNAKDKDERSPLHSTPYPEVAQLLMNSGADPHLVASDGSTPADNPVVAELLEADASADSKKQSKGWFWRSQSRRSLLPGMGKRKASVGSISNV